MQFVLGKLQCPIVLHLYAVKRGTLLIITFYFTRALSHDKEHMGKRYIEVFASKYSEMEWVVTRMAGGEGDGEAVVRLRGLPYGAQKQDIAEFFAGRLEFCDFCEPVFGCLP